MYKIKRRNCKGAGEKATAPARRAAVIGRAQARVPVLLKLMTERSRWNEKRAHSFIGRIYKTGILRCVDVPKDVSQALREGNKGSQAKFVSVRGSVSGVQLLATLVPGGRGCFKMFLHSRIWKKLRVDSGDYVEIALEVDEEPREPIVPEDLAAALSDQPGALAAYRACTVNLRREFVNWLNAAKAEKTRERRIQFGMRMLLERAQKRKRQGRRASRSEA
jgi:bacteriocin resistance YdeI/OmpD-like protein/uncharacterized protein DUF1905